MMKTNEVADIFRLYGGQLSKKIMLLPSAQLKVMWHIETCRTAELGGHCGAMQPLRF